MPLFHPVGSGVRPKPSPFAFGGSVKSLRASGPCRFGVRDRAEAPSLHHRSHLETLAGFQPRSPVPGSGRNPFPSPFSVAPLRALRLSGLDLPVPRPGRSPVISPSLAVPTKPSEVSRPNPDSATRPKSRPFLACRFADALADLRFPDRFRQPRPKPSSLPRLAVSTKPSLVSLSVPVPGPDRNPVPSRLAASRSPFGSQVPNLGSKIRPKPPLFPF